MKTTEDYNKWFGSRASEKIRFFAGCTSVTKSSASVAWCGEHSSLFGQPEILLPINLWTFAGFQKTPAQGRTLEVKLIMAESPTANGDFPEHGVLEDWNARVDENLRRLEEEIRVWFEALRVPASQVLLWSDIPTFVGLHAAAAIGTAVGMQLSTLSEAGNAITVDVLDRWKTAPTEELKRDTRFSAFFHLCWRLANAFAGYKIPGGEVLASFLRPQSGAELLCWLPRGGKLSVAAKEEAAIKDGVIGQPNGTGYNPKLPEYEQYSLLWLSVPEFLRDDWEMSVVYSGFPNAPQKFSNQLRYFHRPGMEELLPFEQEIRSYYDGSLPDELRLIWEELENSSTPPGGNVEVFSRVFAQVAGLKTWQLLALLRRPHFYAHEFVAWMKSYTALSKASGFMGGSLSDLKRKILSVEKENIAIKQLGLGRYGDLAVFGKAVDLARVHTQLPSWKIMGGQVEAGATQSEVQSARPYLHYSSKANNWWDQTKRSVAIDMASAVASTRNDAAKAHQARAVLEVICEPNLGLVIRFNGQNLTEICKQERLSIRLARMAARVVAQKKSGNSLKVREELLDKDGKIIWDLRATLRRSGASELSDLIVVRDGTATLDLPHERILIGKHWNKCKSTHCKRVTNVLTNYKSNTDEKDYQKTLCRLSESLDNFHTLLKKLCSEADRAYQEPETDRKQRETLRQIANAIRERGSSRANSQI